MGGFHFRYRLNSAPPTLEHLPLRHAETLRKGDVVKLEAGEVALAATGDANLLGAAQEPMENTGGSTWVEVITDADAVYAAADGDFRRAQDSLDLTGSSGAHGVRDGPNGDFAVVAGSSGTEETLVRISVGRHAYEGLSGGELNAALARTVMKLHKAYVGRGPTSAHAFFDNDVVVVMMHDVLTRVERSLAAGGQPAAVLDLRRELQQTMLPDLVAAVERLTACRVTAFMSVNHIEPDLAAEVFLLDRALRVTPLPEPPGSFRESG
jgi:uncharacterized protein YbcI